MLDIEPPKSRGWDEDRLPTDKMQKFLRYQGVEHPENMSFAQAYKLSEKIKKRQQHGWCTLNQARSLAMLGYENPKGVREKEAREIINQLPECEF